MPATLRRLLTKAGASATARRPRALRRAPPSPPPPAADRDAAAFSARTAHPCEILAPKNRQGCARVMNVADRRGADCPRHGFTGAGRRREETRWRARRWPCHRSQGDTRVERYSALESRGRTCFAIASEEAPPPPRLAAPGHILRGTSGLAKLLPSHTRPSQSCRRAHRA
jgi:hypothetical protein